MAEDPAKQLPLEPGQPHRQPEENSRHGRLAFRPGPPHALQTRTGLIRLDGEAPALVYVPPSPEAGPMRLVLLLHGAGGSARQGLDLLLPVADEHRLLLLAPSSRLSTWDVILDGYGADVARIDGLLDEVSAGYAISGLAVGGFSDGASYAVSLGVGNGDIFDSVLAFSPGFAAPLVRHGQPRFFVSHGTADRVLPIEMCGRRLVQDLERDGYRVDYEKFDGGHTVPQPTMRRAARWLSLPPR